MIHVQQYTRFKSTIQKYTCYCFTCQKNKSLKLTSSPQVASISRDVAQEVDESRDEPFLRMSVAVLLHVAAGPPTWQELLGESPPAPRPLCGANSTHCGRTNIWSCSRRNTRCWSCQCCGSWRSGSMCGSYKK